MSDHQNIWVTAESNNGKLSSRMTELLGAGRKIADQLGEKVCCVLITNESGDSANEAIAFGADIVYVYQNPQWETPPTEICLQVLKSLAREHLPRAIFMGRTPADLAPSFSAAIGCRSGIGVRRPGDRHRRKKRF